MKIHAWRLRNDTFLNGKYVFVSFLNSDLDIIPAKLGLECMIVCQYKSYYF